MKFTCTKENLSHALSIVGSIAGKKVHLPILTNVLLQAEESQVFLVATDLEMAVRVGVRAKVESTGSFTVPAKTIADFVHLLRDPQIEISLQENELIITAGSSFTKIKGVGAEDFPVIPEVSGGATYTLSSETLRTALSQVMIAAAKNDVRPELSGVYFGFFTERFSGLLLAATDSYRLAEKKVTVEKEGEVMTCIVPGRIVAEMARVLHALGGEQHGEQVTLVVTENQLAMRAGGVELVSRLIDGRYPDYAQIIPTQFKTEATLPVEVVRQQIKAASLFTTTGVNAISFDVNAERKTLGISSTSVQAGEHSSEVEVDVTGEENSILLNHRYVLEGLQQFESNDVILRMNDGQSPCILQGKGDQSYLYIIMPIRQ